MTPTGVGRWADLSADLSVTFLILISPHIISFSRLLSALSLSNWIPRLLQNCLCFLCLFQLRLTQSCVLQANPCFRLSDGCFKPADCSTFCRLCFVVLFSSAPCCLTASSRVRPDMFNLILSISFDLFLRRGDPAMSDGFLGIVSFFKTRGWPLVLHLTVVLSSDSDSLMRISCVIYASSSLLNGKLNSLIGRNDGLPCACVLRGEVCMHVSIVWSLREMGEVCKSVSILEWGLFVGMDASCGRNSCSLSAWLALTSKSSGDVFCLTVGVARFLFDGLPPFIWLVNVEHTPQSATATVPSNSFHRCVAFPASDWRHSMVVWDGEAEDFSPITVP